MPEVGSLEERLGRAKELLTTVRHAALATVNADGSPHNSPVFSTFDDQLNFYWASGKQTQHSQNVARDPRVFVVVFDSMQKGGGLYLQATAKELQGAELDQALAIINACRTRWGRSTVAAEQFTGDNPNRIYKATYQHAWVNLTERNAEGFIVREHRHEISAADLA